MATVTILGKAYAVDREQVIRAIQNVSPEPLGGQRKYFVEIDGQRYPIKQVVAAALGLPRVAFTATHAYALLTKLGFEIHSVEEVQQ